MTLEELINSKRHACTDSGFESLFIPDNAFPFQRALIEWGSEVYQAVAMGRKGMGMEKTKTPPYFEETRRDSVSSLEVMGAAFFP
jgi:hypothetical protein